MEKSSAVDGQKGSLIKNYGEAVGKLALITGGTSGIGAAFARQLASEGYDLVLVARDAERLNGIAHDLAERYRVSVDTLTADLSTDEGVEATAALFTQHPIDLLVNNAGFGMRGGFTENPTEAHKNMMRVNAEAVLLLTHAALSVMLPRKSGNVINVSSVAGFTPGLRPSGTYAATKAFVTALTEGLAGGLEGSGVHISALCPGWVKTEFHQRADINLKKLPAFLLLDADDVVNTALRDHRAGRVISIPTQQYKAIVLAARITPRSLVRWTSRLVGKRQKH